MKRQFRGFARDFRQERIDKLMEWLNGEGAKIPLEKMKVVDLGASYLIVIWEEPEPSKLEMTAADSNME